MRLPAAQNPFCWHWRPSVQGTLTSHLIPGVDSPVPGPGPASELPWRLSLNSGRLARRPKLSGSLRPPRSDGCPCTPVSASVSEAPGSWSLATPPAQAAAEGGVTAGLSLPRTMRANSHLRPPALDPDPSIWADPVG